GSARAVVVPLLCIHESRGRTARLLHPFGEWANLARARRRRWLDLGCRRFGAIVAGEAGALSSPPGATSRCCQGGRGLSAHLCGYRSNAVSAAAVRLHPAAVRATGHRRLPTSGEGGISDL